jgi:hypothetical protein
MTWATDAVSIPWPRPGQRCEAALRAPNRMACTVAGPTAWPFSEAGGQPAANPQCPWKPVDFQGSRRLLTGVRGETAGLAGRFTGVPTLCGR